LEALFAPYADWGLFILRLGLAIVFFAHGLPKIKDVSQMSGFLAQMKIPFPVLASWIVALLETVGSVLLVLGLGTRVLGLLFAFNMFVAAYMAKIRTMKATFVGQPGWEFEFSLLVGSLALVFTGAGSLSIDAGLGW
jgi:uncharacterized membrane protein YphA (DoxX/SURF4 family)